MDGTSRQGARCSRSTARGLGSRQPGTRDGEADALASLLALSVKDSEEILAAAQPDAVDADTLGESVASLSVAYLV
jgi:hypothetical protein